MGSTFAILGYIPERETDETMTSYVASVERRLGALTVDELAKLVGEYRVSIEDLTEEVVARLLGLARMDVVAQMAQEREWGIEDGREPDPEEEDS